eukprot:2894781-Prymnesium_polylepis.2
MAATSDGEKQRCTNASVRRERHQSESNHQSRSIGWWTAAQLSPAMRRASTTSCSSSRRTCDAGRIAPYTRLSTFECSQPLRNGSRSAGCDVALPGSSSTMRHGAIRCRNCAEKHGERCARHRAWAPVGAATPRIPHDHRGG